MKIIVDKIDKHPGHALSRADIRLILSAVPQAWTEAIRVVRLCSLHEDNPHVIASFHPSDGSLMIRSRGFSKERVLRALLTELAGHALGVTFLAFRRLQKRDLSRVEQVVAPLVREIMPQFARKHVRLVRLV